MDIAAAGTGSDDGAIMTAIVDGASQEAPCSTRSECGQDVVVRCVMAVCHGDGTVAWKQQKRLLLLWERKMTPYQNVSFDSLDFRRFCSCGEHSTWCSRANNRVADETPGDLHPASFEYR